jgi:hypothetical protein
MPFKSSKQKRFFGMCASGKATKAKCPPRDIVDEFFKADRMERMGSHGREARRGRSQKPS